MNSHLLSSAQMPYIDIYGGIASTDLDLANTNIFADNPEDRCAVVLLLDTSASMTGDPIKELNAGIIKFKDELAADPLASKRVEIAIVTFGPVHVLQDFVTFEYFNPPVLEPQADTPMGSAIETALELLAKRKQTYKDHGIAYYRPWVFLITDGGPTDSWAEAARKVKAGESQNSFSFFCVGVKDARMDILEQIANRQPLKLKELRFHDLFVWLSSSLKSVSASMPGTPVTLPNPATPDGWASV